MYTAGLRVAVEGLPSSLLDYNITYLARIVKLQKSYKKLQNCNYFWKSAGVIDIYNIIIYKIVMIIIFTSAL